MCTFVSLALGPWHRQVLVFLYSGQQHGHSGVILVEEVQYVVEVQVCDQVAAHYQHVCRFLMNTSQGSVMTALSK